MNDWLWYGGEVSLDFVNTVRDRYGPARETLNEPADLTRWIEAAGFGAALTPSRRVFDSALRLRTAVSRLLEVPDDVDDRDLDLLTEMAAGGANPPRLVRGEQGDITVVRPPVTAESALSLIALDAIDVFDRGRPDRIRTCAHDRCGIVFYDSSRAGSRRWCSMERCGNRAKVAKHAARSEALAADASASDAPADDGR